MPAIQTAIEEWEAEEAKLRAEVLALQREIADQYDYQTRVFGAKVMPHTATAKLRTGGALRMGMGEKIISAAEAARYENSSDPTEQFEWGRFEVARVSTFIRSRNAALTKKRTRLLQVREHLSHARRRAGIATSDTRGGLFDDGGGDVAAEQSAADGAEPVSPVGTGVSGYPREWLDRLRARAHRSVAPVAGDGRGVRA